MRTWTIVPAAGGGTRFGGGIPKQYADLAGTPVLMRTLDRLATLDAHETIVALAPDDTHYDGLIGARRTVQPLRCGGATRATASIRPPISGPASAK